MSNNPEENQLNIELPEEMAEGAYVNLALIAHSPSEFVLDFIRILPGIPKAKVKSRVVMTPDHANRLLMALQENIAKYEEAFGPISKDNDGSGFNFPMNYNGPIGEA
ncbi:DUF3467 domain-containing protein [Aquirufa sp. ROCK-SH2]|jgi:hypothetical protein